MSRDMMTVNIKVDDVKEFIDSQIAEIKKDYVPRSEMDEIIKELSKEADLMTDRQDEDCMAVYIDDAIAIVKKHMSERENA